MNIKQINGLHEHKTNKWDTINITQINGHHKHKANKWTT